jgi:hypothetical protein
MKTNLILIAAVLLAGCGTTGNKIVPSNRFKDSEREITLAQDNQAKNITIDKRVVDKKGNTNFTTIKIKGLQAKNSPEAITAAGAANAASIAGYSQMFQAGVDTSFKMLQLYLTGGASGLASRKPAAQPRTENFEGKEYLLIQEPDSAGRGIYVYEGPDGKSYTRGDGKMIVLP